MEILDWARGLAEDALVDALPRRWAHVQGVARAAERLDGVVGGDVALLRAAAFLHDIGYAPTISSTGFHPLDGARYLKTLGAPERLVGLVAHHSCAAVEARLRNLERDLWEFSDEEGPVRDALWYCDVTTSPDGQPVTPQERFREIQERYGPEDVVSVFVDTAKGDLLAAVQRTEWRLLEETLG